MSVSVKEPVLIVGIGGTGSRLATDAKKALNSDCVLVSTDEKDFNSECDSIKISTGSIINPTVQLIRGSALGAESELKAKISQYSTVIVMANLAGKTGSAIAPIVTKIAKEAEKNPISFAIMPFQYEKDRIFNSGVSLKRVKADSRCTIVLDNDSLLESNPDLSTKDCYKIGNTAILHIVNSLNTSEISEDINIVSTGRSGDIEESLRDSLKMLYENAPPNAVKKSMIHVVGGENIPVGVINSLNKITNGITDDNSSVNIDSAQSDESNIVMVSSVQSTTKFDKYDPLGMIPQSDTLDWSEPDCSIDCKLDLYQLE
ncbi:MAG: cell division protein FtsZ [Nitrosopumilaceae archaeon]|nr:cell division protein FtsZ [Nitrosopumilaceae archaeon]